MTFIRLQPNAQAAARFRENVQGRNFMTPDVLVIGRIRNLAVEISEGEGITRERIFGVTVMGMDDGQQRHELSKLCHSIDEVNEHLAYLRTRP